MKRVLLILLFELFLLLNTCVPAQKTETQNSGTQEVGEICGYVTDSSDGTALVGATVTLLGRYGGAIANTSGSYRINKLSPGKYQLEFSIIGYDTRVINDVLITDGEKVQVNVELSERIITLKGISVTPGQFQIMGTQ